MRSLTLLVLISAMTIGMAGEVRAENPTAPIRIRGHCVDEQGKGIAGAEVFLAEYALEHRTLAQTITGPDGFYEFIDVAMPYPKAAANDSRQHGLFQVFGFADGFGFAWLPMSRFGAKEPKREAAAFPVVDVSPLPKYYSGSEINLKLVFPKARTLSGRVVDDRGMPIVGARLAIRYCDRQVDQPDFSKTSGPDCFEVLNATEIVPPDVKTRQTDMDGRFKFSALPPDCRLQADVRLPGGLIRSVWLTTKEGLKADRKGTQVYSDGSELVFPTTYRIPIRVKFGDSKEPAEKVRVGADAKGSYAAGVTDVHGALSVSLPAGQYRVELLPRIGTPYQLKNTSLIVTEKSHDEPVDLELEPAAVVEVTVVDARTGKGLEGADLWLEKDGARSLHFFRSYEVETRICHVERPRTNAEGKLIALFPPGKHRIGVALHSRPAWYGAVEPAHQVIECRAGEPTRIKFQMTRGTTVP